MGSDDIHMVGGHQANICRDSENQLLKQQQVILSSSFLG